jgi:hypothetical protein
MPSTAEIPTWSYGQPDPTPTTQYLASLNFLSKSLPVDTETHSTKETTGPKQNWKPKYQHMLQTLTDLTGYLTTQTYILPAGGFSGYGGVGYTASSMLATPQQEEIRKEIRAMKGLALSRYRPVATIRDIRSLDSSDLTGVLLPSQRFLRLLTSISNDLQYVDDPLIKNIPTAGYRSAPLAPNWTSFLHDILAFLRAFRPSPVPGAPPRRVDSVPACVFGYSTATSDLLEAIPPRAVGINRFSPTFSGRGPHRALLLLQPPVNHRGESP